MVLLREPDPDLAARYLDATERYLPFYQSLLGPYPFRKFAVVENLLSSGWGMPSFTLLGSRVMRLPFIAHTSLPHEILHNWWGNGVLVDPNQGNWSEGLTAYLADHLLAQSRGDGVRHRRDALARYRSAVHDPGLAPLRFRARHDRASQAVGYDKPMMIFHMLRRARGDEAFIQALSAFFAQRLGRRTGAAQLFAALQAPGEDWFEQWWSRADAPSLALQCCELRPAADGQQLHGRIRQLQSGPPFRLNVPVQVLVEGEESAREFAVRMHGRDAAFTLRVPRRARLLAVDAGFDLMRVPGLAELPPSVGELLGAPRPRAVLARGLSSEFAAAYDSLASRLGASLVDEDEAAHSPALWILGAGSALAAGWRDALVSAIPAGDSRVMVTRRGQRVIALVEATSPEAVRALASKLPHYGRYGLLGFAGEQARNVFKGVQPVLDSPLRAVLDPGAARQALPLAPRAALGAGPARP
jgi:hypothetical protein